MQAEAGLTDAEVDAIQRGWDLTMAAAQRTLLEAGAYQWQMTTMVYATEEQFDEPDKCTAFLRQNCDAGSSLRHASLVYLWANTPGTSDPRPVSFEQALATLYYL